MKALSLLTQVIISLSLSSSSALAAADEIEWARFDLSKTPAKQGHVSRDMTVRVVESGVSGGGAAMSIDVWQGECGMKMTLGEKNSPSALFVTDAEVRLSGEAITHRIYQLPGGLEWEIILTRKPDTGFLSFDIEIENLAFYRQDSLSDFERVSLGARRPDSVVGAWVAYHCSKAHNRCVIRGADTTYYDYGTGQAFIIYRPRAWDNNDTTWCELSIDDRHGRLMIQMDPEWLDSAQYPVTIDPTFGNTAIGASTLSWNQYYAYCHTLTGTNTYTVPQNTVASITGYSVYGCETGAGDLSVNMAGFDIDDGYPGDRVEEAVPVNVSGGTPAWFFSPVVVHTLEPSMEYGVAVGCAPRSGGTIYYNSVTNATVTDNNSCYLASDQWTFATVTNFNLSMYATYTEEDISGGTPGWRRRELQTARNERRGY